jgi:hypothetical protein
MSAASCAPNSRGKAGDSSLCGSIQPSRTSRKAPHAKLTFVEHHIIPQFYLRGFRDPAIDPRRGARVWTANLKLKTVTLRSPKTLAKLTDYYAVERVSGSSHVVETEILMKVEDAAAKVVAQLRDGGPRPTDPQRSDLAVFIATLSTRTPGWRLPTDQIAAKLAESVMQESARHPAYFADLLRRTNSEKTFSDEELERMRVETLDPGNFEYRANPVISLDLMIKTARELTKVIFLMNWCYVVAPVGKHFVTNDGPVFWYDPQVRPPAANGLRSPGCILTFPIGPEVALTAIWGQQGDITQHVNAAMVDFVNQRIIRTADSCVFARCKEEAEEALARRAQMEARNESVGPRQPDIKILGSSGERLN